MMKKGFKVTNLSRDKKVGIAAETLDEFLKKSCEKLKVKDSWQRCRCYVAEDGTLVDDDEYFRTLPSQTLLVILQPEENMKTELEYFYEIIRLNDQYLEAGEHIQDFFNKDKFEKFEKVHNFIKKKNEDNSHLSDRSQDPEWFEGITTCDKTKEAYMSRKAKDRIQGYLSKTKNLLVKSNIYIDSGNSQIKNEINTLIKNLQKMLKANNYNCLYFDRRAMDNRLCNESGKFVCGGLWSEKQCRYLDVHVINPYRSKEERILFSTWNLDHRMELSRSIVPSILSAVQCLSQSGYKCYSCTDKITNGHVSTVWYFKQLFTTENLKLVHIVCHDKRTHDTFSELFVVCERCWKNELPN